MTGLSGRPDPSSPVDFVLRWAEAERDNLLAQRRDIDANLAEMDTLIEAVRGVSAGKPPGERVRAAVTARPAAPAGRPRAEGRPDQVTKVRRISGTSLGVLVWMSLSADSSFTNADLRASWRIEGGSEQKILKRLRGYGLVDEVAPRRFRINAAGMDRARVARESKESFPVPPT